jgi:hypothetical protein
MKILIENTETLEMLTSAGAWTKNTKQAATYPSSTIAKQTGAAAAIGKFNVIGRFANSAQITNLDEGCGTAGPKSAQH